MEPSSRISPRSAHSRTMSRSEAGIPSTAEITSIGKHPAKSTTRSAWPDSITLSM